MITIKANGVTLPAPVDIKTSDELIWSSNTGRSTTGKMIGDIVAEKTTFEIAWGVLTKAELSKIKQNLVGGFFSFAITIDGTTYSIDSYRSTLASNLLGTFGGETYYKDASVSIVQQ